MVILVEEFLEKDAGIGVEHFTPGYSNEQAQLIKGMAVYFDK